MYRYLKWSGILPMGIFCKAPYKTKILRLVLHFAYNSLIIKFNDSPVGATKGGK